MFFAFEIEDQPIVISLYKRKYYRYYAMALYITQNPQIAQDVVQNSFADFIGKFDDHRHMGEDEMERYIMAMVRNQAKRKVWYYIREPPHGDLEDLPDEGNAFLQMEQKCDAENVRKALAMVPERVAEYLVLYYVDQMNDASIAKIMEVTEKSVPVLRHRARRTVKRALERLMEEGDCNVG